MTLCSRQIKKCHSVKQTSFSHQIMQVG